MQINERGRLTQLVFGQMAGQVVSTAARLGLADLFGDARRTSAELAARLDADPGALHRLLRAMAGLQLLAEVEPGSFELTGIGALLRTDRPDSLHEFVRMFTDPAMMAGWRELDTAVRTGRTTFEGAFGVSFFDYLAGSPELSELFNAAMRQATRTTARLFAQHYDLSRFHTALDIGGGDGTLLAAALAANLELRGVVYDTEEGLAQAETTLRAAGVAQRATTRVGDFFAEVPAGAELYLIKSVVHDWDDDRAATILGHCRRVIPQDGRLLVVEPVLPDRVCESTRPGIYLSDLNMLVNVGGRERTLDEFDQLCRSAGFAVTDVRWLPPESGFALIEAAPA